MIARDRWAWLWLVFLATGAAAPPADKPAAAPKVKLVAKPVKPVPLGGEVQLQVEAKPASDRPIAFTVEGEGNGTVDDKGLFHAPPSHKTPAKVTVHATLDGDPKTSVAIAVPLQAVAVKAKASATTVPLGGETTVDAKVEGAAGDATGVKFELTGEGTIDDKGHYLAPKAGKTPEKVTVKVTSVADPSKSAMATLNIAAVKVTAKASATTVPLGGEATVDAKVEGATGDATGVKFELAGEGTIDDKGHYLAPKAGKTPSKVTIKAISTADPSKVATVAIAIAPVKVSAKASATTVPLGGEATVDAKVEGATGDATGVKFELAGEGTIDDKGHYVAPKAGKTPSKVTIKAISTADPSKVAAVAITIAPVKVSAKASATTVPLGGEATVDAQVTGALGDAVGVKFELAGEGTIDDKGHYLAPKSGKTPGKVTVKATSVADPSKSATATLNIAAVKVTAKASATTVPLGGEATVDAQVTGALGDAVGVKFELAGEGTIDDKGHYLAPKSGKTPGKVTIKVISTADPSKSASVAVGIASVAVHVKPPGKPIEVGGEADLEAQVSGAVGDATAVTWSVVGEGRGTIDAKGHLVSPRSLKTPGGVTIKATSVADPTKSATATVPIAAVSVAISPRTASLQVGGEADFSAQVHGAVAASQGVTWSVEGGEANGTIDAKGHYTAPDHLTTPKTVTIKALADADPSKSAAATLAFAPIKISARAPTASLEVGGTTQLEAQVSGASGKSTGVTWKVETPGGGAIDDGGLYRAPDHLKTPARIAVRVTSVADPSKSAPLTLAFPAIAVTLGARSYQAQLGGGAALSASLAGATGAAAGVSWSVEGQDQGTIDEKGHYTAPAQIKTPARINVRASANADPSKFALAAIEIPAASVSIDLKQAEVELGGSQRLAARVENVARGADGVAWSVSGEGLGSVDPDGTYRAPEAARTPAKVTVRATSSADPSKLAEVQVSLPAVGVALSPDRGRIPVGQSLKLAAQVSRAADAKVDWSVEGGAAFGKIDDGTYTAPAMLPEPPVAHVVARAHADPGKSATAAIDLAVAGVYSVASEQRISGGQLGALLAGSPSRHRLAVDGRRVAAAYNDGASLYLVVSEDRGHTFKAPSKLLSGKGPIAAPALAVGPDHALWLAFRAAAKGQPGDVVVCRAPDFARPFEACTRPNGKPVPGLVEQALALGPDGAVSLAWIDAKPGSPEVMLARSANRGASWEIHPIPSRNNPHGLALAVGDDGVPVVAWAETDSGKDRIRAMAGEGEIKLALEATRIDALSLAARDKGHAVLAYQAGGRVEVAALGGAPIEIGAEAGATQDEPVLARDGDRVQLAFRDVRQAGQSIRLARSSEGVFARGALAFDPPQTVNARGPAIRGAPSLAVDRAGRGMIAWLDGRGGDAQGLHQDLFLARADEHPVQIEVSAPDKPLLAGQTAQLRATVRGAPEARVTWSIDDGVGRGTVDAEGTYTAPLKLVGSSHVYVRATSLADPTRSAAALVELAAPPELRAVEPDRGGVGEAIALTGAHFGSRYPGFGVRFGGVPVSDEDYLSWTDDQISVRLPFAAKTGSVEVTTAGGTCRSAAPFNVLPVEVSVSPAVAIVPQGDRQPFAAAVAHAGDKSVRWELDRDRAAGTLGRDGVLQVDLAIDAVHRALVRAVSVADPERAATAEVVTGPLGGKVWQVDAPKARGPALDAQGTAYVSDKDGAVISFDREGKVRWSTEVARQEGIGGTPPVARTPVVAGDRVVVVVQNTGACEQGRACTPDTGELVALSAADGSVLWRAELGEGDFSDAAVFPGAVAVARYAGALMAYKLDRGGHLWTAKLPKGLVTAPRAGPGGTLHGTGDGGVIYAVSAAGKVLFAGAISGKPGSLSRPAVGDGVVYATGDDGVLRAYDLKGQVKWTAALGGRVPTRAESEPLLGGDTLYLATSTTVEAFDLEGNRRWKAACGACSAPLVQGADGVIYAGRYAPQAFSREGKLLWSGQSVQQGERWSSGALTSEGLLLWTDLSGVSALITSSRQRAAETGDPPEGKTVGQR